MDNQKPSACVIADPPWEFETWSEKANKSPSRKYSTMSPAEVAALGPLVNAVLAADCVLCLWATWPCQQAAYDVAAAWGFEVKTVIPWVKVRNGSIQQGTGYRARCCSEPLLVATRGKVRKPETVPVGLIVGEPKASCGDGLIVAPRFEHSRKPDAQYDVAEGYPGPYLELFARPTLFPRPGWTYLGLAVTGKDIREDLRALARSLREQEAACHPQS